MIQFKLKCKAYLSKFDLHSLRPYGRSIGVSTPAAKNKDELIEDIVAILAFELAPVERSKRGAPVKNDKVDESIPKKIAEIKAECFKNDIMMDVPDYDFQAERKKMLENGGGETIMRVADPQEEARGFVSKIVSRGQVSYINGEWLLLPLDCAVQEDKIPIPLEIVSKYNLRDGDSITCNNREKDGKQTVAVLLTVNNVWVEDLKERPNFEERTACYSQERIRVFDGVRYASPAHKYVEWLMPVTKGQRACVISAPKAGKTRFLLQLAEATQALNRNVETFALLIDQSYETAGEYRRVFGEDRLLYTTYEDDADRQVFVADFILKRAKRFAEMGRDVVLFVDSLSALARAFNDTEASMGGKTLACGLESKTVHYIKKYFGAARCLEEGGSITVISSVSVGTGNPMDESIAREISELATLGIDLSDALAVKRVYPAIDLEKAYGKYNEMLKNEEEEKIEFLLYNRLLPVCGAEGVLKLLTECETYEQFVQAVKRAAK